MNLSKIHTPRQQCRPSAARAPLATTALSTTLPIAALIIAAMLPIGCGDYFQEIADSMGNQGNSANNDARIEDQSSSYRFLLEAADEEQCAEEVDGLIRCTWEDVDILCDYAYTAEGEFAYQNCSGDWGTYDCYPQGETIECALSLHGDGDTNGGGYDCTDTWSSTEELLETTCDFELPEEGGWGSANPDQECITDEEGTKECWWTEHDTSCVAYYTADEELISQSCSSDEQTSECIPVDGIIECTNTFADGEVCVDTWEEYGEPIELGCEQYYCSTSEYNICEEEYGDFTDEAPAVDSGDCGEIDENGYTNCTNDDGETQCTYTYDAQYWITKLDCVSYDGRVTYNCETNADDGLLYCVQVSDTQTCEEVVEHNELISSTCAVDEENPLPVEDQNTP